MDALMKYRTALQEELDDCLGVIAIVAGDGWRVTFRDADGLDHVIVLDCPLPGESVSSWVESSCRAVVGAWVEATEKAVKDLEKGTSHD